MFEQEYTRANDRIHPRKDLLKEMEGKWAAEQDRFEAEEEGKVVRFPGWVRYGAMAAGILMCVGLGMGSVMLLTRDRGDGIRSAKAEAPMMMDSAAEAEVKILTDTVTVAEAEEEPAAGMLLETKAAAAAYAPPTGMHPAVDAEEVAAAVRFAQADRSEAAPEADRGENEANAAEDPVAEAPAAADEVAEAAKADPSRAEEEIPYGTATLYTRDDLMTVFLPTMEQVHVVRYTPKMLTNVFSLTLREHDAQVRQFFWMGNELLAVRERDGGTELLRFDVSDWKAPRHLNDLPQSGTFLCAGEVGGRLVILSLYEAAEEEPLPRVNGERLSYTDVVLDNEKPGNNFTVITVYDPAQDGFAAQKALLGACQGAAFGKNDLLLWNGDEQTSLYRFTCDEAGLTLAAETVRQGTVLDAAARNDGYELLLQDGVFAEKLTLNGALEEMAFDSMETGVIRCGQLYEDGAVFLTDDALWVNWESEDRSSSVTRSLALVGDGFRRLSADRLVVISAAGQLHLVALDGDGPTLVGSIEVKEDLSSLLKDPSRMAYDADTGRLVFPAGQRVYQYRIEEGSEFSAKSTSISFTDHKGAEVLELRCVLLPEKAIIFCKDGVVLCNENLARQATEKY